MNLMLAALVCFLAGFTDVKLFDVQTVELCVVAALGLSVLSRPTTGTGPPEIVRSAVPKFLWMFFFMLAGSALSLRLTFYPPSNIGFLKLPPYGTFVRAAQVMIAVSSMFVVAFAVRNDPRNLKRLMAAYVWCGLVNAGWGIASFAAWPFEIELPGVGSEPIPRLRGFFVEGGPFGVYMTSVALIQYIRYSYLKHISFPVFAMQAAVIAIGLVGSQSKSAVLILFFLGALYLVLERQFRILVIMAIIAVPAAWASNLFAGIAGYVENFQGFASAARLRPEDANLVMGRLMASILLPRMIAEHPWLGIGIGNYSVVRNDPSILRGLPTVNEWDLHGLGILGYLAELGIPLTAYVMYLYAYPALLARKGRKWILLLGAYPLLAALFGVQINFAYPWIVAGLTLAAVGIQRSASSSLPVMRAPQPHARRPIMGLKSVRSRSRLRS